MIDRTCTLCSIVMECCDCCDFSWPLPPNAGWCGHWVEEECFFRCIYIYKYIYKWVFFFFLLNKTWTLLLQTCDCWETTLSNGSALYRMTPFPNQSHFPVLRCPLPVSSPRCFTFRCPIGFSLWVASSVCCVLVAAFCKKNCWKIVNGPVSVPYSHICKYKTPDGLLKNTPSSLYLFLYFINFPFPGHHQSV